MTGTARGKEEEGEEDREIDMERGREIRERGGREGERGERGEREDRERGERGKEIWRGGERRETRERGI